MPAKTADDVGRVRRGIAHRVHVGNHLGAAIPKLGPGVPRLGKETKIFGAVNPRAWALPEHSRLNQFVLARFEPGKQSIGAFGLLGGALDNAANQKKLRVMASMQFGIDGLHTDAPVVENKIPELSSALRRMSRLIEVVPPHVFTPAAIGGISRTSFATSRHAWPMW
jgi:hypothetical protein